jgi:ribosome-binding protein aMBF1 (putative translation factor)
MRCEINLPGICEGGAEFWADVEGADLEVCQSCFDAIKASGEMDIERTNEE